MAYVARNHLESILDHTPLPEYPADQEIEVIINRLNQCLRETGAQILADTA